MFTDLAMLYVCMYEFNPYYVSLLPTNGQGQQTYIDFASTSTLTATKSETLIVNGDKQHSPEDDVKEESVTIAYTTELKTVIERYPPQGMKR